MRLIFFLFVVIIPYIASQSKEDLLKHKLELLKIDHNEDILQSPNLRFKSPSNRNRNIEPRLVSGTYVTKLDHFNPTDTRFVTFGYDANLDYYSPFNPIFIQFKDFDDTSISQLESGLIEQQAYFLRAALYTTDYRFFGKNIPTEYISDASFENLELLTIEQILGDVTYFITSLRNQNYYGNIIVWGSGFGGTIATFARQKLGHLIDAAYSTDGLLQFQATATSFYNYLSVRVFFSYPQCYYSLEEALHRISAILNDGDNNEIQELEQALNLCEPIDITSKQGITYVIDKMTQSIADYISANHFNGLERMCDDLAVVNDSLQSFLRWYNHMFFSAGCRDLSYENFIEELSSTNFNSIAITSGARQTHYLECTQIGLLKVSDPPEIAPMDIDEEYRLQICEDIFGVPTTIPNLERSVDRLRKTYGTYFSPATFIIFTNGEVNPWFYYQQIIRTDHEESYTEIFAHYGKSGDLNIRSTRDPESAFYVKANLEYLIDRFALYFTNRANKIEESRRNETIKVEI